MKRRMLPIALAVGLIVLGTGAAFLLGSQTDTASPGTSCAEVYLEATGGKFNELAEIVAEQVFGKCHSYQEFVEAAAKGPHDIDPYVGIEDVGLVLASTICTQTRFDRMSDPICDGFWDLPGTPPDQDVEIYRAMESGFELDPDAELESVVGQVSKDFKLSEDQVVDAWIDVQDWVFTPLSEATMDKTAFAREAPPVGAITPDVVGGEELCGFSSDSLSGLDILDDVWVFDSTMDASDYVGREIAVPHSSAIGDFDHICVFEDGSGYQMGFPEGLDFSVSLSPFPQDYSKFINDDPPHYPGTTRDIVTFELVDVNGLEGLGINAVPDAPPSRFNTESPASLKWRDAKVEFHLVAGGNNVELETLLDIARTVQ